MPSSAKKDPEEHLTLIRLFLDRSQEYVEKTALVTRGADGRLEEICWAEWARRVRLAALGLYAAGVRKGDRVAIFAPNSPEWAVADFGILSLGAVGVPVYPGSSVEDVRNILEDSQAGVVFVSTWAQAAGLRAHGFHDVRKIIYFGSEDAGADPAVATSLDELLEAGRLEDLNGTDLYEGFVSGVSAEDPASIIYTSGTTGLAKGVVLTHRNLVSNYCFLKDKIPVNDRDVVVSILPLSHVFERLAGYYYIVFNGGSIAYAKDVKNIASDLLIYRPTIVCGVPRFYEKMYEKIMKVVNESAGLRRAALRWALSIGGESVAYRAADRAMPLGLRLRYGLADKLVLRRLREGMGGRIRFFISGGAPLSREVIEFFYAAGLLILEGYGLTETSPVISTNAPHDFRFGTVGKPCRHVEVKIAGDGEIMTRSACVMKGYYGQEQATRSAVRDGWFYTGDIGCLDADGYLTITDRKKDLIITAGGKNISPQRLETLMMTDPLFRQVVILGDKRPFLVALLAIDRERTLSFGSGAGMAKLEWKELCRHPSTYAWVRSRLTERLRERPGYEQIKAFAILENELTSDAGELTPTLKVKRRVMSERYGELIEKLYRDAKPVSQGAESDGAPAGSAGPGSL